MACHLARAISGEIISADSRQIYCGMDIGTGKDLDEYYIDGQSIPYHLINIKQPGYKYNIEEYQRDFKAAFELISSQNNMPILCGGSGLYLETALCGNSFLGIPADQNRQAEWMNLTDDELNLCYANLPAEIREKLNALTRSRKIRALEIHAFLSENSDWKPMEQIALQPIIFGLSIDRELRREKIVKRLSYRLNHGMIEEVENLLKNGLSYQDLDYYGLEYKWVGRYLSGEIRKKELFDQLSIAIHQFAKKQMTWFRRMEKNGFEINWLEATDSLEINLQKIKILL